MKSRTLLLPAVLMLVLAWVPQARAGGKEAGRVASAAEVLESLVRIPEKGIPPALLREAHAVAIFPDVVKAGFILGGRHGHGVLLVREPSGFWSNPIFLTVTGGSIGWQAGVQGTDLVLVLRTPRSVERLLQGRGKFTLGADASVAAGPVGRELAAATDVQLKAEILSWSRSRGLFGGLSLSGDSVRVDWDANGRFYGNPHATPADILANRGILLPEAAVGLRNVLGKLAAR